MSLEPSASDSPSSPREETNEGRETGIVASVAVLALILGTLVQVVFPPAPRTLIVLADSGNPSAVISLEDGVIQLPEPTMVDIMPLPEGEQS